MILTLIICFVLFLMLGMPISILLIASTTIALLLFTHTPLVILVQQLFNALDTYVLMAIPFFILAGGIMTKGAMAQRLIDIMNLFVGRFRGGAAMAAVVACVFFRRPERLFAGDSGGHRIDYVSGPGQGGLRP